MGNWNQGYFTPKNKEKYIGHETPYYRSSWELTFMQVCDNHPNILQWASEEIKIPYYNPVKRKQTIYIPDFFIVYVDNDGNKKSEIIEIKPNKETTLENAKTKKDKLVVAINHTKWEAAKVWAKQNGLNFRIMTEQDLYMNTNKQQPNKSQNTKPTKSNTKKSTKSKSNTKKSMSNNKTNTTKPSKKNNK